MSSKVQSYGLKVVQDQILRYHLPDCNRQSSLWLVWLGFLKNPVGLLPTPLDVEVLHGWQLCPGDVLCSFHHPLYSLMVEVGATAVPGGDAASQDTLYSAPVEVAEYPGVHVEPPQPTEEEEPLSGCLCDGVCVVRHTEVEMEVVVLASRCQGSDLLCKPSHRCR